MASLAWMLVRNVTSPATLTTMALSGLVASGIVLWTNRHTTRSRTRSNERRCRSMVAAWLNNPDDPVWGLLATKDDTCGKTAH